MDSLYVKKKKKSGDIMAVQHIDVVDNFPRESNDNNGDLSKMLVDTDCYKDPEREFEANDN